MKFNPLVSIVIPVFNGANYLREAIDSALAQTYENVEVLVINDGSNDDGATEEIALSYGEKIRYFHKKNGGVAAALNMGISEMRGEYFSWLSHDDLYSPEKIEKQINHLSNLKDKQDIVFSGWIIINEVGREINRILPLKRHEREKLESPLFPLINGMISGCNLLIHKNHFERVGKFNEDLPTTQDFDLWFRMMRGKSCRICEGVLHKTRIHNLQGSRVHSKAHVEENDVLWIKIMSDLSEEEKIQVSGSVQNFYSDVFMHLLKYSVCKKALKYARQYCKANRLSVFVYRALRLTKNKIKDWM